MLGSSLAATLALATDPASYDVHWHAPDGCPTQEEIETRIAEQLPEAVAVDKVSARAQQVENGWAVDLEFVLGGETRVRELPPQPTCSEAASAAVFVIAIALDPSLGVFAEDGVAEGERVDIDDMNLASFDAQMAKARAFDAEIAPGLRRRRPPRIIPVGQPKPPDQNGPRVVGFAETGVAWNHLPKVGVVVLGGVGLQWRNAALRATGSYWPNQVLAVDQARVHFRQWSLGATLGPRWKVADDWLEIEVQGGFEGGEVRVNAIGVDRREKVVQPWGSWVVVPALAVSPVRWLAFGVRAHVIGALVRSDYWLGDVQVHAAGWIALRGTLFLEGRFP